MENRVHTPQHVWRSEDHLVEVGSLFPHFCRFWGSSKLLYALSYFVQLIIFFKGNVLRSFTTHKVTAVQKASRRASLLA